jgi:outer membrane receptor protein involved in Fe transport
VNRFFRILTASLLTLGLVGPFCMATTFAQTQPVAQNAGQTTGTVTGSIHDASGAPVANATVKLAGAATLTGTTDAQGAFTFNGLAPGIYSFTATKAGYTTATESTVSVLGGQTQTLAVVMNTITFSSLRTIAAVRSVGRGTFNTTPASVSVVSSQTFQDQAQPQVMKILNETPGIVASLPSSSGNGSAPGAITFPNIRGALSFESASLIDGHPVSVGTYGDYVTTFLNPFMLQNVEVVKGPGADAPEVNYAIGGTVNFRTKDPTYKTTGIWQVGTDNWGSTILNFGLSDTVGRLGYVFAYGSNDLQSNISNSSTWVSPQTPQQGVLNFNGTTGTGIGFNDKFPTPGIPGTISTNENVYNLVACCQRIGTDLYQNQSELAKLRYRLSNATAVTFTYIGSQTYANQVANTGDITHSTFTLTGSGASAGAIAGYNGSVPNNSPLDIGYVRTPEHEINNEPILEGDIRTTLNNDTILARYYAAGIHRTVYQGSNSPFVPTVLNMNLYGYDSATKTMFNGQSVPVAFFDYYNQSEHDALKGYSFEYDHPFAADDVLTFTYDTTHSTTTSFSQFASGTPAAGKAFNTSTLKLGQSVTLPTGSEQNFSTAMLRGAFHVNPKLNVTWSNYFNIYKSTYPTLCTGTCLADGTGYTFDSTTRTHYDPRLAVEFRATPSLALRFSAGSAIAPPYLALLSGVTAPISAYKPGASYVTQKVNSGALHPETAFGEDLGGDYRFHDGVTYISADIYHENLFNHFITGTFDTGATCPATDPVTGNPTGCPANLPLYFTTNTNLGNARFEGVELELRRVPQSGLGYTIQGALQRGYAYNLPPYFYCLQPGPGCKANTNLGIIEGQNFSGGGIGGNGLVANGLSNQNVPYAQGYGELNYRTGNGWYGNVNLTYYGKNNSLYEPAFTTLGATVRAPLGNGLTFQISGDNLTDKYSDIWPSYGTGVQIPLANGQLAATQANVLYPRTIRFTFTKSFGSGTNQ